MPAQNISSSSTPKFGDSFVIDEQLTLQSMTRSSKNTQVYYKLYTVPFDASFNGIYIESYLETLNNGQSPTIGAYKLASINGNDTLVSLTSSFLSISTSVIPVVNKWAVGALASNILPFTGSVTPSNIFDDYDVIESSAQDSECAIDSDIYIAVYIQRTLSDPDFVWSVKAKLYSI